MREIIFSYKDIFYPIFFFFRFVHIESGSEFLCSKDGACSSDVFITSTVEKATNANEYLHNILDISDWFQLYFHLISKSHKIFMLCCDLKGTKLRYSNFPFMSFRVFQSTDHNLVFSRSCVAYKLMNKL